MYESKYVASHLLQIKPNHFTPLSLFSIELARNKKVQNTPIAKNILQHTRKPRRTYTKSEDAVILCMVKNMGFYNPNTWKVLTLELNIDCPVCIRNRGKLLIRRESNEAKEKKRYTEKEDKIIVDYIEANGQTKECLEELKKKLAYDGNAREIKHRYDYITNKKDKKLGKFSEEEDLIILNDVKLLGKSPNTFKKLADKLNRPYPQNIMQRLDRLETMSSKAPIKWNFEDDKTLLKILFEVMAKTFRTYIKKSNNINRSLDMKQYL